VDLDIKDCWKEGIEALFVKEVNIMDLNVKGLRISLCG
jgi:hypothetical protein